MTLGNHPFGHHYFKNAPFKVGDVRSRSFLYALLAVGGLTLWILVVTPVMAGSSHPAGSGDPTTPLPDLVSRFQSDSDTPQRRLFEILIQPRLDVRHVSEFVIGRHEIQTFIERHRPYFEMMYHRSQPGGDMADYEAFIEQFMAPEKVEIGTFFFKERFGLNEPFPILLFDAAFDGEGIRTLGDLQAALQSYEMPRLALMARGIDYGSFQLDRERFLKQHLFAVKLVLECIAVDTILLDAARGKAKISQGFEDELGNNYVRYVRMLKRLTQGALYTIDPVGNPFCIDTPLDIELARAQRQRMHFALEPDPATGRLRPVPATTKRREK